MNVFKKIVGNLLSWQWTEDCFNWILMSGGKLASMLFLASGIWLSIYNSVKDFVIAILPQGMPQMLTYLSKVTFTALPEIILFLSALNTLDQIKLIRVSKKGSLQSRLAWTWTLLFGIPTLCFISYALFNIAGSLLSSQYTMPDGVVVLRGLTCFAYAVLIFIYSERGRKCFADEIECLQMTLIEKQTELESLANTHTIALEELRNSFVTLLEAKETELAVLQSTYEEEVFCLRDSHQRQLEDHLNTIDSLRNELHSTKGIAAKLSERASSLVLDDLASYPNFVREVVDTGLKTITVDFLSEVTGLSKRKIANAKLLRHSRNKDLIMVSSAIEWLRKQVPTTTILQIDDYMEA